VIYYDKAVFGHETVDNGFIVIGSRTVNDDKMLILKLNSTGYVDVYGKSTVNRQFVDTEIEITSHESFNNQTHSLSLTSIDLISSSDWDPQLNGDRYCLQRMSSVVWDCVISMLLYGLLVWVGTCCIESINICVCGVSTGSQGETGAGGFSVGRDPGPINYNAPPRIPMGGGRFM
jgi:hypothetical protein